MKSLSGPIILGSSSLCATFYINERETFISDVNWFETSPEEPGFYWYVDAWVCDIVRVYRSSNGRLRAAGTALFEAKPLDGLDGRWAGPIPVPREVIRARHSQRT